MKSGSTRQSRSRIAEIRGRGCFSLLSSSSKWIVAVPREGASNGTLLYVWSLVNEGLFSQVNAHYESIQVVSFHPKENDLFSSSSDGGEVKVWRITETAAVHLVASHLRHKHSVVSLEWHPSKESLLLSAGLHDRVLLWDWTANRVTLALSEDCSALTWCLDGLSFISSSPFRLALFNSSTGDLKSSHAVEDSGFLPYKVLPISSSHLLVLSSQVSISSRLYIHSLPSLQLLHSVDLCDEPSLTPFYNSDLSLLALASRGSSRIRLYEFFPRSPWMKEHSDIAFAIYGRGKREESQKEVDRPICAITCHPLKALHSHDQEIVRLFLASSSSFTIDSFSIAQQSRDHSGHLMLSPSANSINSTISAPPPECLHTTSSTASLPPPEPVHTVDPCMLALKWNFLSKVTQPDYRSKEERSGERSPHRETPPSDASSPAVETPVDNTFPPPSYLPIEPPRVRVQHVPFLASPEGSSTSNESPSIHTPPLHSPTDADPSCVSGDWRNERNGKGEGPVTREPSWIEGEEESEWRSEGEAQRHVLEETVCNLEKQLRKSERERGHLEKRLQTLETDMASLRFEMEWKDGRIAELVASLSCVERMTE